MDRLGLRCVDEYLILEYFLNVFHDWQIRTKYIELFREFVEFFDDRIENNFYMFIYLYLIMYAQVVKDGQKLSKTMVHILLNKDDSKHIKIVFNFIIKIITNFLNNLIYFYSE